MTTEKALNYFEKALETISDEKADRLDYQLALVDIGHGLRELDKNNQEDQDWFTLVDDEFYQVAGALVGGAEVRQAHAVEYLTRMINLVRHGHPYGPQLTRGKSEWELWADQYFKGRRPFSHKPDHAFQSKK